jgi:hypothetical protein
MNAVMSRLNRFSSIESYLEKKLISEIIAYSENSSVNSSADGGILAFLIITRFISIAALTSR